MLQKAMPLNQWKRYKSPSLWKVTQKKVLKTERDKKNCCEDFLMWKIFVKEKKDEKMEEKKTGVWQDWDVSGKNYDRWGKFGMQHIDDNLLEKVLQGRSTNDVIKWFLTFALYHIFSIFEGWKWF